MRARRPVLLLLASTLAAAVVGCGSDNSGPSNPAPPAGTYTLTSLENPPNPVVGPPVATGPLILTATTYSVTIDVVQQPEVHDEGTYTISGGTWSQTSTTNQGVQSTGTFTYDQASGVLTVDVTVVGIRTITVWQKQ